MYVTAIAEGVTLFIHTIMERALSKCHSTFQQFLLPVSEITFETWDDTLFRIW